jgi:hypothetical protein
VWPQLTSAAEQGDQIGRIFAHWAIVSFGHFFEKWKYSTSYVLFFNG